MPKPTITNGYILLSRKLIESTIWFKPPLYLKVWIYILCKAQHKEYKSLKSGQFYTTIQDIQEACSYYVGYRKEVPSVKQIRSIINWLRNPYEGNSEGHTKGSMIVTTKVTHGMVITVENYNVYQDPKNYEGNSEGHYENPTKDLRTGEQGRNINKNDKNDNTIGDFFDQVWLLYPNKKGRNKVSDSNKKKIASIGLEEMTRAINRYKTETKDTDIKFIKHGSTFFNGGYTDYLDANYETSTDNTLTPEAIARKRRELGLP